MKLLKNYTFTWWQMALFKICLLALGIAVGAYWSEYFVVYAKVLVICSVLIGVYLAMAAFRS